MGVDVRARPLLFSCIGRGDEYEAAFELPRRLTEEVAIAAHKLTDAKIKTLTTPKRYADGAGLFLQVTRGEAGDVRRSWFVRLRLPDGRVRDMGLGTYELLSLADARVKSVALRAEAKADRDPLAARQAAKAETRIAAAKSITFKRAAEDYIRQHAHLWRNAKHVAQWSATLTDYAYPAFGSLPVSAINVPLVIKALEPIWTTKPETASRVRQRIEKILDWAKARGLREGENPARWQGNLQHALPKRDARSKGNHAALPFTEAPAFWIELNSREGVAAKALAFAILTAARTSEVLGADWREIDLEAGLWTVPGERMKAGREHRVPLSKRALGLLRELGPKAKGLVFAGPNGPLSNMAMLTLLKRMDRANVTVHGFRSTFRDWAAERTAFPREVAEAALAHAVGDATERAYRRGDALDKRAKLMSAWARYLETPPASGAVVSLKARTKMGETSPLHHPPH